MAGALHASGGAESDTLTTKYVVQGLRVIHRINPTTQLVAVRLYLLGGTRQLTETTAGIETLLLSASQYGTQRFPGEETRRALGRTGSRVDIEAEADWTVFGFQALQGQLEATWAVFADRLMHPTLDDSTVGRARARLRGAARRRWASPEDRIDLMASETAFRGHPYALDPRGTDTSLAGLSAAEVARYQREQLVTSRMLLVVVGNVDRTRIESLVAATLGQLPAGSYVWSMPPPVPRRATNWMVDPRPQPTNYILGYFPGPPVTSLDYPAFRLATYLLSGRLFSSVRSAKGLSYDVGAPFLERAIPVGGVSATTQKPEEVIPLMLREVSVLTLVPVSPYGLDRFVDQLVLEDLSSNATSAGQADQLARAELFQGDYHLAAAYLKILHRVKPEDIRRVAGQYMPAIQYAFIGDTARMSGKW
jgi:zinc protease